MVLDVSEQAWLDVPRRGILRNANGKTSDIREHSEQFKNRVLSWANRECRRDGSQNQIMSFLTEAVSAVRRSGVAEGQVRSLRRNGNSLV